MKKVDTTAFGGQLNQHPFVARLLQHVELSAADLKSFAAIMDGDLSIRRRHDLVVDGLEYRKLCFVKDGYAVRYKLLRNGKRQIVSVVLPGDVVGMPGVGDSLAFWIVVVLCVAVLLATLLLFRKWKWL